MIARRAYLTVATLALLAGSAGAQDNSKPGEGVTIRPVIPIAVEETFQNRVLFRALEELGYDVADAQEVQSQTMVLAVGTGDADFTAAYWDKLHQAFYDEAGGDGTMEKVGRTYIQGAVQGYLVDKAAFDAGVKTLEDLKKPEVAKMFDVDGDGKADLYGCVPGWGCERVIEHQLTEYGLRDTVTHNQGDYNAIIADAIARQKSGEHILYYTWTPYWVSGVLVPGTDSEWLTVPYTSLPDGGKDSAETTFDGKNLGFALDDIGIIARKDFLEANPAAKALFEAAKMDINDVSAENKLIADGEDSSADIDRHVDDWIKAHQAEFDSWVAAGRAAAKS